MNRIRTFFSRALRLARLGASQADSIAIFCSYIYLSGVRALGGNYAARSMRSFAIAMDGARANVYYKGLLDFYIMEGVFIDREYDVPLSHADIIFDLGSNTGITVVFFKLKYPDARVHAFEPDPSNAAILRKNAEQFGSSVTVYEAAVVGEPRESVSFFVSKEHWSSSGARKKETDAEVTVRAMTLDQVMQERGLVSIDILKFDIEGAEYDVLAHFKGLSAVRFIAGEVHEDLMSVPASEFFSLLGDFEYRSAPLHRHRLTVTGHRR